MEFLWAFLVGGALCALAQLVVDLFHVDTAHTMVGFVVGGAIASGLGLYGPLAEFAQAGATIPLSGFGHTLVQGVIADLSRHGPIGLLGGGLEATAIGITASVLFGYLMALAFNPKL